MISKLLAAALAVLALQGSAMAQETIKIGLLTIESGPMTIYMPSITEPAALAIELLNAQGGALGRKYELVTQAHAGTPVAAVAALTRLAEQQGVSFVTGFSTSAAALAIAPRLGGLKALYFDPTTTTDELTGKSCQPNYFHIMSNDSMAMNVLRSVVRDSGVKTWDLMMPDYAMGHDLSKNFGALLRELGGSVRNTLFAPLSTTDFGSYLSQLAGKPGDGLAVAFPGSGGVILAKQQQQYGVFSKYKTVLSYNFTNDIVIGGQGDTTVGVIAPQSYLWQMGGERNAAFVKAFEGRYKRKPTHMDGDTYVAFEMLHAAITKARSADLAAVREALSGLKTATIFGDVEMRAADHQLARPMTLVEVTRAGESKGAITLRSVVPASRVMSPPSGECKL